MSALTRSRCRLLIRCSDAIQAGVPVVSKRRLSCSRTSDRVRNDALTCCWGTAARCELTMPYTTRPTPIAAATATRMIGMPIGQSRATQCVVKCQRPSTSLGPTPAAAETFWHLLSGPAGKPWKSVYASNSYFIDAVLTDQDGYSEPHPAMSTPKQLVTTPVAGL